MEDVMRRTQWIAFLLFCLPGAQAAEDWPRIEAFVGYSYLGVPSKFSSDVYVFTTEKANLNGWTATITYNFNRWIGVDADFGRYDGNVNARNLHIPIDGDFVQDIGIRTYLFGPRVSFRENRRLEPHIHALFGTLELARTPVSNTSKSSFGLALGGGMDVKLIRHLAIRAIQVDYVRSKLSTFAENNLRLSTGAVLRF
jgi:opacity protein-like surface antigen